MVKIILVFILVLFITFTSYCVSCDSVINSRKADINLLSSIKGALIFLYDNQIRNRPGKLSSTYDSSDTGDGCKGKVMFNVPLLQKTILLPAIGPVKIRNLEGEWTSSIHFLPARIGNKKGQSIVAIQDSNIFVPSFVMYPMFLFRENNLVPDNRYITKMLKQAWNLDKHYKRGKGYNFWLPLVSNPKFTGPYNIPVDKSVLPLAKAYLNPKLQFFWIKFAGSLDIPPHDWVEQCLDLKQNPAGANALFNIPDDADDSSTAVSIQKIKNQLFNVYNDDYFFSDKNNFNIDYEAVLQVSNYRDLNRKDKFEDGRDSWKGKNSGAFLTWFKDEEKPVFSNSNMGVIPLAKNNVDAVVNANVILSLGLIDKKNIPGYDDSIKILIKAIKDRTWPRCGLYYPQYMIFPYTVSRAYRDGNNSGLKPGILLLLKDLLEIQTNFGKKHPEKCGAFPGGVDKTYNLSTALGVTALLNIGVKNAIELGLLTQYKKAIYSGISYLIKHRKKYKSKNNDTFGNKKIRGYTWGDGLFFSASFWDLAQWRSQSYTNAMVLEALSKFLLAYEYGNVDILSGRRIYINSYKNNMKIEVK